MTIDPFSHRKSSVRAARERLRPPPTPHHDDGARSLFGIALALLVFIFVVAISTRQATSEGNARRVLEAGIATLTDIDQVIAEERPALRALAANTKEDTVPIPGYPLDVALTKDEAVNATDAELRAIVLARSSALVYADGLDAFDRTGSGSSGLFSRDGLLRVVVGQLSETTHQRASFVAMVSGALAVIFALAIFIKHEGFDRIRAIGFSVMGGAVPGTIIAYGAGALGARLWGGDPFSDDVGEIIQKLFEVPFRNFLAVSALGVALSAGGVGLAFIERRMERRAWAEEDGFYTIGAAEEQQYPAEFVDEEPAYRVRRSR